MRDIVLTALDYLRWYTLQFLCRVLVSLTRRDDEDPRPPAPELDGT